MRRDLLPLKIFAGAAVGLLAAVAAIAFFVLDADRDAPSADANRDAPSIAGWRTHEGASFSVDVPERWQVASANGQVVARGDGTRLLVWPVFIRESLDSQSAPTVARELAADAMPDAHWGAATAHGDAVRLVADDAVAVFTYAAARSGTAGQLAIVSGGFDAATVARVLESFEARGEPVTERPAVSRTTWTDPNEGAFSVQAPADWTTTGGTVRPSSLLVQATVRTASPDGEITALMTDALPVYVEPNNVLAFSGIGEGGTYIDPTGYRSPVRSYRPGATYLTEFVLPEHETPVEVTRVENRSDLASQLATYGINSYDAGEVEYRFERNGVAYNGGALAITEKLSLAGFAGWHVWRLFMVEAPTARYAEGIATLRGLAESFRIDEAWAARQAETTRQQSGIITQMSNDIGETLSSGYWARQQVYDALSERRSKATLEVEDVTDEAGNTYRVESGSDYYWIDPRGTIVGTNTHTKPDVDFHELVATT